MTNVKFTSKPFDAGLTNLVDGFFSDLPLIFNNDFNKSQAKATVPVNVKESDKAYELEVIAPGLEKSDFVLTLEKNMLTISYVKKTATQDEAQTSIEKMIRQEFEVRSFKRSFTLDEKIDATRIGATYLNGVLTLSLPKKEEVKVTPTQIEIK